MSFRLSQSYQKELNYVFQINKKKVLNRWEEKMMPLIRLILTNYEQMKQMERTSTSSDFRAQKKLLILKLDTFAKYQRIEQSNQTDRREQKTIGLTKRIDTPLLNFESVLEPDDYENRPVHLFNALDSWELDKQIEEYFHKREDEKEIKEEEILEFYLCSVE